MKMLTHTNMILVLLSMSMLSALSHRAPSTVPVAIKRWNRLPLGGAATPTLLCCMIASDMVWYGMVRSAPRNTEKVGKMANVTRVG